MAETQKQPLPDDSQAGSSSPKPGPSTWNRNVKLDAAGDFLDISITGSNPPPPPPPPGHSRNDTALVINVFQVDRGGPNGTGAKILYHAINSTSGKGDPVDLKLTGIEMKDGSPIPSHLSVAVSNGGKLMTLTVTKAAGDQTLNEWDYYVQGTADDVAKQTEDPQLRNHP